MRCKNLFAFSYAAFIKSSSDNSNYVSINLRPIWARLSDFGLSELAAALGVGDRIVFLRGKGLGQPWRLQGSAFYLFGGNLSTFQPLNKVYAFRLSATH
ncbi:MAG TPA: hypothetical protein ENJ82_12875 [Bacteroidetes bacterium]|nr:hypothetical protein [Bacteroidota bacterium]